MDIQQIIKERYKELPDDIQRAIKNTDLASKFNLIAKKHSLLLDQNGALQTETILVMLGIEPTENYVENVQKALNVSEVEALSIAEDVNAEILNSIKDSLREIQEQDVEQAEETTEETIPEPPTNLPTGTISDIEQAGDFTIDPQLSSSSDQYNDTTISKEAVLKGIEDQPIPMVDHLLTTPVSAPQQVEVKKVPEKSVEKKGYTADPYREAI